MDFPPEKSNCFGDCHADPQLCRLCAKSTGPMSYIFGDTKEALSLAYKINTFLPIKVRKTDPLPKQVCASCVSRLEMISEYAEYCVEAEDKLKSHMREKLLRSACAAQVGESEARCPLCSAGSMKQVKAESLDFSSDSTPEVTAVPCEVTTSGIGATSLPESTIPEQECSSTQVSTSSIKSDVGNDASATRGQNDNISQPMRLIADSSSSTNNCSGNSNSSDNNNNNSSKNSNNNDNIIDSNNDISSGGSSSNSSSSSTNNINNLSRVPDSSSITSLTSDAQTCNLTGYKKIDLDGGVNHSISRMILSSTSSKDVSSSRFLIPVRGSTNNDQSLTQELIPDMLTENDLIAFQNSGYFLDMLETEDIEVPFTAPENGGTLFSLQAFGNSNEDVKPSFSCHICQEKFSSEDLCLEHSLSHMDMNQFLCRACGLQFSSSDEWASHCKEHTHDDGTQYLCKGCDELFETFGTFNSHICPSKKTYKCDECGTYFASEIRLVFHRNYTHGLVPLSCMICKIAITNASEFFSHMKTIHLENNAQFCQLCGKQFANTSQFMIHVRTVHEDYYNIRPYICKVCGKQFHNKQILQGHYVTHMEVKPFKCEFCGMMLARKNSLRQHLLSHHAKSFPPQTCYQCNTCSEAFTNLGQAVAHTDTHGNCDSGHEIQKVTVSQLYMCEYCENCYTAKSGLIEHRRLHKDENLYFCKICKATFSTYGRASKHRLIHLRSDNGHSISEEFTVSKLFVCEECDKCFPHWTSICHHRRNQHQSTPTYSCSSCNEAFKKFSDYQEHRRNHTIEMKQDVTSENGVFKCDLCEKSFGHRSTLVLHQRIHTGRQPHTCKICGDKFRLKGMYEKHMSKHTGTKPYVCEVCGKGFTQNSGLYTHRRVHTGEKPYPCDMCDKHFRLKHDRDNHRRCHTGERPYRCMYCGKAFRTSHDHRQHQLIHTGQRPYACHYCGKGFRRINALNVHRRIHTGERPYGCELCGRYFTQKGDMMKHRKTQHGVKTDHQ